MLDLDNFKAINDIHGHNTGDEILVAVAKELTKYNTGTNIVSRYGGDEFLFLISSPTEEDSSKIINEIIDIFKMPFKISKRSINVNASIGYACYPKDGKTLPELIEKADKALYESKDHLGVFATKYYSNK